MKNYLTVVFFILMSVTAQARLSSHTIARMLEGPGGQRLFKMVTGETLSNPSVQSLQFMNHLKQMKTKEKGNQLAEEIISTANNLAAGKAVSTTTMNLLSQKLTDFKRKNTFSLSEITGTGKTRNKKTISDTDNTQRALIFLEGRVAQGEITPQAFSSFSKTIANVRSSLGIELLSSGASNCMKNYSPDLIRNFMSLVSALNEKNALVDMTGAFRAMVEKAKTVFPENNIKAEKRICGLAGHGYNCQMLNPQVFVI